MSSRRDSGTEGFLPLPELEPLDRPGHSESLYRLSFQLNQPATDAATSQVYYLSFKYSSTCFGHEDAQNMLSCI